MFGIHSLVADRVLAVAGVENVGIAAPVARDRVVAGAALEGAVYESSLIELSAMRSSNGRAVTASDKRYLRLPG